MLHRDGRSITIALPFGHEAGEHQDVGRVVADLAAFRALDSATPQLGGGDGRWR